MKKQNVNMLSGPITKGLVSLIIPIMIMNCFQSLVSIIDMSVLGRLVNDDAVGAVGTCGSLISLITLSNLKKTASEIGCCFLLKLIV